MVQDSITRFSRLETREVERMSHRVRLRALPDWLIKCRLRTGCASIVSFTFIKLGPALARMHNRQTTPRGGASTFSHFH